MKLSAKKLIAGLSQSSFPRQRIQEYHSNEENCLDNGYCDQNRKDFKESEFCYIDRASSAFQSAKRDDYENEATYDAGY